MKKIIKSESEWKKLLNEEEFWITRKKGTEKPFHNSQIEKSKNGLFKCKCCNTLLFNSSTKFDSGSGWPSFYDKVSNEVITEVEDNSHGMKRIEVICSICDAHLGHLFEDGPEPTGLRYCINSLSLKFEKSE
jgi:peptide-methionine (R)-S-oxide reductase